MKSIIELLKLEGEGGGGREEGRDVNLGFLRERDHISVLATGFQSVTLYWTPGQLFLQKLQG